MDQQPVQRDVDQVADRDHGHAHLRPPESLEEQCRGDVAQHRRHAEPQHPGDPGPAFGHGHGLPEGDEEPFRAGEQAERDKPGDGSVDQCDMPDPAAQGGLAGPMRLSHQHHRPGEQAGAGQHQEDERGQAQRQIGQLGTTGPAGHHRVDGGHDQQPCPRDHHRRREAQQRRQLRAYAHPQPNQTQFAEKRPRRAPAGHPRRGHRHRQPPQLIGALAPCHRMGGIASDCCGNSHRPSRAIRGRCRACHRHDADRQEASPAAGPDGALRGPDARA